MALIVKVLEDGSVGKLGIVKESGYVGHLSKSTNKNEMDRLRKVNEKELKVGTPYPTLQRADINQVGPTAGAKSTFSSSGENIIPQNIAVGKLAKQEKRSIYNVTYNGKFSTPVYKDVDNAIKYAKGDKSKGAKHIEIRHLNDDTKEGYVTKQELLKLGDNIRAYIKEHKEPFIDKKGGHIYEWEDKDGVRFRAVIGQTKRESDDRSITSTLKSTDEATKKGQSPNSSLYSSETIITFYSDRNLKEPMKFENPKLKLLDAIDNSSDKAGAVKKILLNKHISDSVKAKAVNKLAKNKFAQATKGTYISTKNSQNN